MRIFASAGNKVIFVNSISMGLPGLAHKDLLPRIKRKLGSYSKLARQTCNRAPLRYALDRAQTLMKLALKRRGLFALRVSVGVKL